LAGSRARAPHGARGSRRLDEALARLARGGQGGLSTSLRAMARGGGSRGDRRPAGGGRREERARRARRGAGRDREAPQRGAAALPRRPHPYARAPALAVLIALAAYPTAYLIRLSLSDWTPAAPVPVLVGAKHLARALFEDTFFWKSLGLTLL